MVEKLPEFLPDRARTTLNAYGHIDMEGLQSMVTCGLIDEAIYPLAKTYDHHPLEQEGLFTRLICSLIQGGERRLAASVRAEVEALVEREEPIRKQRLARILLGQSFGSYEETGLLRVESAQLIQFNRSGWERWREEVQRVASECLIRQVTPILPAYAVLVGLPKILGCAGCCYLLNLGWIADRENPYCGLQLTLEGEPPALLVAKGTRFVETPVYVLDDTISTGKTVQRIREYLAECGNYTVCPRMPWDARPPERRTFPVDGTAILRWAA